MIPLPSVNTLVAGALALVIVFLGGSVFHLRGQLATERQNVAALKVAISDQKSAASQLLAAETEKVRQAEARERDALRKIELAGVQRAEVSKKAGADLRSRTRAGGGSGLLDPHARGCGCSGSGSDAEKTADGGAGTTDGTQAGGVLSEPLERDLVTLVSEADQVNDALAVCKAQLHTLTAPAD